MSENVVGIIGATVGIGRYVVNDYVITLAEAAEGYGYTMTVARGNEVQTVSLYGLTRDQYDSMVSYLEAAQSAASRAEFAADRIDDLIGALDIVKSGYEALTGEAVLTRAEVLRGRTVGVVGGSFKLIDSPDRCVIKVPTAVLEEDPFLILHPNNMVMVGTTYQLFWSNGDDFAASGRRSFTTDVAVWRRSDANNAAFAYIYIPVSSDVPDFVVARPKSAAIVPPDMIVEDLNNLSDFDVNSSGLLNYHGTSRISRPFVVKGALYASAAISMYVYETDGTFAAKVNLAAGRNDTGAYSGKLGVLTYLAGVTVSYDIPARLGMIATDYLTNQVGWKGRTLYCYGDSVTEQGMWQPYLNRVCGFGSVVNGGHSGYRLMLLATTANIDAITDPFDVMVVMAGINDWTQDRPIGAIDDVNTDAQAFTGTFYGGLNQMLDHLTAKWPNRRFLFVTPTYAYLTDSSKFFGQTGFGEVNSIGLTLRDYADAMVAACRKWNVPCLDLLAEIGWNANNVSTYVKNDATTVEGEVCANYSHPNNAGAKVMAGIIARRMEAMAPVQ